MTIFSFALLPKGRKKSPLANMAANGPNKTDFIET